MLPVHDEHEEEADHVTVSMIPRNPTHTPMIHISYHNHTIPCPYEKKMQEDATRRERRRTDDTVIARNRHVHAKYTNARMALGRQGKTWLRF